MGFRPAAEVVPFDDTAEALAFRRADDVERGVSEPQTSTSRVTRRRSAATTAPTSFVCGRSTANSSPPYLAAKSVSRTTPAIAPATATGLLVAETLRISTGPDPPCEDVCEGGCCDVILRLSRFWAGRAILGFPRCDRYLAYSTLRVSRSTTTLMRPA